MWSLNIDLWDVISKHLHLAVFIFMGKKNKMVSLDIGNRHELTELKNKYIIIICKLSELSVATVPKVRLCFKNTTIKCGMRILPWWVAGFTAGKHGISGKNTGVSGVVTGVTGDPTELTVLDLSRKLLKLDIDDCFLPAFLPKVSKNCEALTANDPILVTFPSKKIKQILITLYQPTTCGTFKLLYPMVQINHRSLNSYTPFVHQGFRKTLYSCMFWYLSYLNSFLAQTDVNDLLFLNYKSLTIQRKKNSLFQT